MLARAVQNFADDLQVISEAIKGRTVTQIKGALQRKAFDDAGIVIQQQVVFWIIFLIGQCFNFDYFRPLSWSCKIIPKSNRMPK